jgi:nucleotide-binding universal stress UspA family protein
MPMWKAIVCGVDDHPGCADAVRVAARLAREQSADLVLLHVVKETPEPGHEEHGARLVGIASDARGAPVQAEVLPGDPADALINYAASFGSELIVLGTHAHHRALLAGSLVGKVLARARCPVLVVPCGLDDVRSDFPGQVA